MPFRGTGLLAQGRVTLSGRVEQLLRERLCSPPPVYELSEDTASRAWEFKAKRVLGLTSQLLYEEWLTRGKTQLLQGSRCSPGVVPVLNMVLWAFEKLDL